MNQYKFLGFDIEIVRPIPPGEREWRNYRPLGISCAALQPEGEPGQLFYHGMGDGVPLEGAMDRQEMVDLYHALSMATIGGYTLLTWNGMGFDFDVLQEELTPDHFETVKNMSLFFHVDMMLHFLCIKGYRLGLEAASLGMGLAGKTEGLKGNLAPLLWMDDPTLLSFSERPDLADLPAQERRALVLQYVGDDAQHTLDVARAIEKAGAVRWTSQKGRPNEVKFPDGWLVAADALELPHPNTAWMDIPIKRSDYYRWTGWEPSGEARDV